MQSSNKKTIILGVVILVIALAIAAAVIFIVKRPAPPVPVPQAVVPAPAPVAQQGGTNQVAAEATTTPPVKMAPIPHGSQTYQIMQAYGLLPRIVQATVDPVDVHGGDTQTMTVIVSDPDPITSVVATIQTDNGTTTVPLALVGPAALNDVLPQKYFVNAQNELAFVDPNNKSNGGNVAEAAQGDEKYSATWTVKDTHTAKYHTVFTATDAIGHVNSVEINWTDVICQWGTNNYGGTTLTLSTLFASGCTMNANDPVDGVENGNLKVDQPLTIVAGTALVINGPTYGITFSGSGSISLNAAPTSQIVPGQMYGTDADHDGWLAGSAWATSTGGTLRSSIGGTTLGFHDCNDSNPNVNPGATGWFTSPTTTDLGAGTYDYDCSGAQNPQYSSGYVVYSSAAECNVQCGGSFCSYYLVATTTLGSTPGCGSNFQPGYTCALTSEPASYYGYCTGQTNSMTQACDGNTTVSGNWMYATLAPFIPQGCH